MTLRVLQPFDGDLIEEVALDDAQSVETKLARGPAAFADRSSWLPAYRRIDEGAAPVLIDRFADLDAVIEPLVKGGYDHAGQVCVSVQRIFVQETSRKISSTAFAACRPAPRRRSDAPRDGGRALDPPQGGRPR